MSKMEVSKWDRDSFPIISSSLMSDFLIKAFPKLEKRLQTPGTNIHEIIDLMCRVCTFVLEDETLQEKFYIRRILAAFQKIDVKFFESSGHEDLFHNLFMLGVKGTCKFSSESWKFLMICTPSVVETMTMELLQQCQRNPPVAEFEHRSSAIVHPKLVEVCCENKFVFQKVLSMFTYAFVYSGGNSSVQEAIADLVATASHHSSIVSLFPTHLQHLVILFSIPPAVLQNAGSPCLWSLVLKAMSLKLCSRSEVILLLASFPLWYEKLLSEAGQKVNKAVAVLEELSSEFWNSLKNCIQLCVEATAS